MKLFLRLTDRVGQPHPLAGLAICVVVMQLLNYLVSDERWGQGLILLFFVVFVFFVLEIFRKWILEG